MTFPAGGPTASELVAASFSLANFLGNPAHIHTNSTTNLASCYEDHDCFMFLSVAVFAWFNEDWLPMHDIALHYKRVNTLKRFWCVFRVILGRGVQTLHDVLGSCKNVWQIPLAQAQRIIIMLRNTATVQVPQPTVGLWDNLNMVENCKNWIFYI